MCGVIREVEKEGLVSVKHYLKVAYGTFRHQVSFNPDTTNTMGSISFFHIYVHDTHATLFNLRTFLPLSVSNGTLSCFWPKYICGVPVGNN